MSSNSCSRFRKSNWHSKIHVIGGPDVLVKMGKLKKSLISASSNVLLFTFALVVRDSFHAGGAECIDITYRRARLIYKYSIYSYLQLYSQIMPDQLILHSFFQTSTRSCTAIFSQTLGTSTSRKHTHKTHSNQHFILINQFQRNQLITYRE